VIGLPVRCQLVVEGNVEHNTGVASPRGCKAANQVLNFWLGIGEDIEFAMQGDALFHALGVPALQRAFDKIAEQAADLCIKIVAREKNVGEVVHGSRENWYCR